MCKAQGLLLCSTLVAGCSLQNSQPVDGSSEAQLINSISETPPVIVVNEPIETEPTPVPLEFEVIDPGGDENPELREDFHGVMLYVTSPEDSSIYQLDPATGEVKLLLDAEAGIVEPRGIAAHSSSLFWSDASTGEIWKVGRYDESTLRQELVLEGLDEPSGLFIDGKARLYFVDSTAGTVSRVSTHYVPSLADPPEVQLLVSGLERPRDVGAVGGHVLWTQEGDEHIWAARIIEGDVADASDAEVWIPDAGASAFDITGYSEIVAGSSGHVGGSEHVAMISIPMSSFYPLRVFPTQRTTPSMRSLSTTTRSFGQIPSVGLYTPETPLGSRSSR